MTTSFIISGLTFCIFYFIFVTIHLHCILQKIGLSQTGNFYKIMILYHRWFEKYCSRPEVSTLWPMSQVQPAIEFVNKVLLKHRHTHSFTHCPGLFSRYNDSTEYLWQRPPGPQSKTYLLHGPYRKNLLTPDLDHWFSVMTVHWEHLEEMFKHPWSGSIPRDPGVIGLGCSLCRSF